MQPTPDLVERIRKIRNDPWEFLKGVRTLDEVDRKNPIKPYPIDRPYAKLFVRLWQRERLLLVPKSRRMTMSWTCIALTVWETMFYLGRNWAFVSKKENDSGELVKRAEFILNNFDPDIIPPEIVPRFDATFCNIEFPELNSKIMGFASGADQMRQYTFSGILWDEMAFGDNIEDAYGSAWATIEGKNSDEGGKFIGISSAAPGFFQRLVFDQLDQTNEEAGNVVGEDG